VAVTLETLVAAWKTNMAKITVANGFYTTIATVTDWGPRPTDVSQLPAIDVRDMDASADQISLGSDQGGPDAAAEEHVQRFDITLAMNSTATNLRKFIMDVRKCVRDNMTATYELRYLGHEVIVDQEEKRIVGAVLRFDVTYRTALLGEE